LGFARWSCRVHLKSCVVSVVLAQAVDEDVSCRIVDDAVQPAKLLRRYADET